MNKHIVFTKLKGLLFGSTEYYLFKNKKLKFTLGSRPVKRKYRDSPSDVVRNDVLQIDFFENNFKEDDVLWDIGSHNGHYSVFAASVVKGSKQVFSFEPDGDARQVQKENLALNKFDGKVSLYDVAVSNVNGTIKFKSLHGNSNSHIAKGDDGDDADVIAIPSRTLNSLLEELPYPTFVKIDTEGAEIDILSEGSKLLADKNIRFICELHPFAWDSFNVSYAQFENLLKQYDRKISLLDQKKNYKDLPYYGTVLF